MPTGAAEEQASNKQKSRDTSVSLRTWLQRIFLAA